MSKPADSVRSWIVSERGDSGVAIVGPNCTIRLTWHAATLFTIYTTSSLIRIVRHTNLARRVHCGVVRHSLQRDHLSRSSPGSSFAAAHSSHFLATHSNILLPLCCIHRNRSSSLHESIPASLASCCSRGAFGGPAAHFAAQDTLHTGIIVCRACVDLSQMYQLRGTTRVLGMPTPPSLPLYSDRCLPV